MEQRLRHLEQDMATVKTTLGHMQENMNTNMATKADLFDLKAEMHSLLRQHIMWNVGSILAAAGLVFAIMRWAGS
ncbi:hypothetical protein SAMN05421647_102234 [Marinobacterium stanieri]|uniref:Haemolysin XhlA n=2 Tax=Marinobacterium stanieri TaxID=49186 RepID=A0A1N6Q3U2_9GAMM|nr:hypothetical protein SAMN05421647_102234 [Marinobacterium stanieri]